MGDRFPPECAVLARGRVGVYYRETGAPWRVRALPGQRLPMPGTGRTSAPTASAGRRTRRRPVGRQRGVEWRRPRQPQSADNVEADHQIRVFPF